MDKLAYVRAHGQNTYRRVYTVRTWKLINVMLALVSFTAGGFNVEQCLDRRRDTHSSTTCTEQPSLSCIFLQNYNALYLYIKLWSADVLKKKHARLQFPGTRNTQISLQRTNSVQTPNNTRVKFKTDSNKLEELLKTEFILANNSNRTVLISIIFSRSPALSQKTVTCKLPCRRHLHLGRLWHTSCTHIVKCRRAANIAKVFVPALPGVSVVHSRQFSR